MNIKKLLMRDSLVVGHGNCYMMDNSCKSLDGRVYRSFNKPNELNINIFSDMDIDYSILIWSDFADNHSNDHDVVLKDMRV